MYADHPRGRDPMVQVATMDHNTLRNGVLCPCVSPTLEDRCRELNNTIHLWLPLKQGCGEVMLKLGPIVKKGGGGGKDTSPLCYREEKVGYLFLTTAPVCLVSGCYYHFFFF